MSFLYYHRDTDKLLVLASYLALLGNTISQFHVANLAISLKKLNPESLLLLAITNLCYEPPPFFSVSSFEKKLLCFSKGNLKWIEDEEKDISDVKTQTSFDANRFLFSFVQF